MEYYKFLRQYVGHQPIILPGAVVIILNSANEVLLQKRYDGGWGLPGGLMEMGESLEDTAKREVLEETGLVVTDLQLLGVFSGPDYYLKVSNGDELYSVTAVYYTRNVQGGLVIDYHESETMLYCPLANLPHDLTDRRLIEPYVAQIIL
ncbi:NUDIX hydrolase [Lysinibacillus sp. ZYM-1]|uniref:NUDIX hydrolase n=1 Tax=Lysinibacillus sp. ZYM-1 TaxID=1681184 RepID=UPI0006CE8B5C|nr:NUDIX hydrolase [Lysinibacillus sp. ZYM-1]KPN98107.1 DNA mismatch repair protein MutT [Lysinibacillus sp. ZYM-1]